MLRAKRGTAPNDTWDDLTTSAIAGAGHSNQGFSIRNLDPTNAMLVRFGDDLDADAVPLAPGEAVGTEGDVDEFAVQGVGAAVPYVVLIGVS